MWSANGKQFAFRNTTSDAVELWVGDAVERRSAQGDRRQAQPDARQRHRASGCRTRRHCWSSSSPSRLGPPPPAAIAASGPSIQETGGQKGESSTYEVRDTLNNKHDEDLFDYYAAAQLALVDAKTGKITRIGKAGVYADVDRLARRASTSSCETIHRPYSYVTTYERFPREVEVWDRTGAVAAQGLPRCRSQDRVPIHGVPAGPREFEWRSTEPATLLWAEALDGGDWNVKVPARDKVMMQAAPFALPRHRADPHRAAHRAGSRGASSRAWRCSSRYDDNRHWTRTFTLDVEAAPVTPQAPVRDVLGDERYKNPGTPVLPRYCPTARAVVRQVGDSIFLAGRGRLARGRPPLPRSAGPRVAKDPNGSSAARRPRSSASSRSPDRASSASSRWHQITRWIRRTPLVRTVGAPLAAAPGEAYSCLRRRPSPICPTRRRQCAPSRSASSSTSARTASTSRSPSTRRPTTRRGRASRRFSTPTRSTTPRRPPPAR